MSEFLHSSVTSSPWFARLPGLLPPHLPVGCSSPHLADPAVGNPLTQSRELNEQILQMLHSGHPITHLSCWCDRTTEMCLLLVCGHDFTYIFKPVRPEEILAWPCAPVTSPSCLQLGAALGCVLQQRSRFCCVSQNNVERCCWLLAAVKDAILLTRTHSLTASDLPCRGLVLLVITKSTMKLDSR